MRIYFWDLEGKWINRLYFKSIWWDHCYKLIDCPLSTTDNVHDSTITFYAPFFYFEIQLKNYSIFKIEILFSPFTKINLNSLISDRLLTQNSKTEEKFIQRCNLWTLMSILVSLMYRLTIHCVIRSEHFSISMVHLFKGWSKISWNCEKMNLIGFCNGHVYNA